MSLFRHGQRIKKRSKLRYIIAGFFVLIFLAIGSALLWYKTNINAVDSNNNEAVVVTIEVGMNESEVSDMLHSKGLIKSSLAYQIYARLNGKVGKMQAGGYKVSKDMNVDTMIKKFVSGDVAVDLLTILPAQRLDQLRTAFIDAGFSQEEVDSALDPNNYSGHPALVDKPPLANLEGYLYPESFLRSQNTSLKTIITASLDQTANMLTPEIVQKLKDRGLNVYQGITLASIVEKEVDNEDDKPTVAQVFLTRLQKGMMLGSDVTAYYGAVIAGLPSTVTADTPYNTRIYTGLPPGPISNVSASSLKAVANPSSTDYLFFVAGDDGKTYFSRTFEEHQSMIDLHCKQLCTLP